MAGAGSIWDDPNATTSETYYEDTFGYARAGNEMDFVTRKG